MRKKGVGLGMALTINKSYKSSDKRYGRVFLGCEKHGRYRCGKTKMVGEDDERNSKTHKRGCPFMLDCWENSRGGMAVCSGVWDA